MPLSCYPTKLSMDPLVSLFVEVRRGARRALPVVGAGLLGAIVILHAAYPLEDWLFTVFVVLLLALLAARAYKRTASVEASGWLDVELGALLMVAAYAAAVHVDRTVDGRFYAVVYVAIGVMSAFAKPRASLVVIMATMAYEAVLRLLAFGTVDLQHLLPHIGFALVFGLLNTLSLRMEVARLRRASRSELQAERDHLREQARSYRLLRAPSSESQQGGQDEERLLSSGVEQIQLSLLFALELLHASLRLRTAVLLWLEPCGKRLRISELVSDETELCEGPFSTRDGIVGAVLAQAATVRVADVKSSYVLPYYADACPVGAACALPVFEHGRLGGVLVVDRQQAEPFGDAEIGIIEQAARFAARVVENERVFVQLERAKVEQGKLYRAAEHLGAAMTEQQVVEAGVGSAREIAAVDFAAITALQPDGGHQIRAASGEGAAGLVGEHFDDGAGLVAMSLHNRHPLPYRGVYDPGHQRVFDARLCPPVLPSLLVLPLVVRDQPLGTLVLGSTERGAFNDAARGLLEVLASHLAVSLSNARMVRRLEEQATTDGLTGLLNKRAMLESAARKLSAAKRFGRRLSVLIADIDLFKKVNDEYGHDVGDIVIQGLARIHASAVRTTDAVARFGGEEFVTICEETDADGAVMLAERIRCELESTEFFTRGQSVRCTCSFGIATYPECGTSWEDLFKAADAALYVSKRSGRNRTSVHDERRGDHAAA